MPRKKPDTVEKTIFCLIQNSKVNSTQIAQMLNKDLRGVRSVCTRLKNKGYIRPVRERKTYFWLAVRWDPPKDMRGTAPTSQANLHYIPQILTRHYREAGNKGRGMVQKRREGTSSEIPQIPTLAALLP